MLAIGFSFVHPEISDVLIQGHKKCNAKPARSKYGFQEPSIAVDLTIQGASHLFQWKQLMSGHTAYSHRLLQFKSM